eukprot:2866230-Amphidinium_carterae.1
MQFLKNYGYKPNKYIERERNLLNYGADKTHNNINPERPPAVTVFIGGDPLAQAISVHCLSIDSSSRTNKNDSGKGLFAAAMAQE